MSFRSAFTGQIVKGDLITIAYCNYMVLAIYIGRGIGGTLQYYELNYIVSVANGNSRKLRKAYVNSPHSTRIMKISPEVLTIDRKEDYEKAIHYLETNNYLKQ